MTETAISFLKGLHPYDALPDGAFHALQNQLMLRTYPAGAVIYRLGEALDGLYIIEHGHVAVHDENDQQISLLQPENSFGERGLLKAGAALTQAYAKTDCRLIVVPTALFHKLRADHTPYRRFFDRTRAAQVPDALGRFDLARVQVDTLMVRDPVTCAPDMMIRDAAKLMHDRQISCLCVVDDTHLTGIVTLRDFSGKAVVQGLPHDTPVSAIMTARPQVLQPNAIGSDVLHMMMEYRLGHLPIVSAGNTFRHRHPN